MQVPPDDGRLSGVTLYTFNFPYYLTPHFFKLRPTATPSYSPHFGSQARYVLGSLHDLCLLVSAAHVRS